MYVKSVYINMCYIYYYVQAKQAALCAELTKGNASENEIIKCLSLAFLFLSHKPGHQHIFKLWMFCS